RKETMYAENGMRLLLDIEKVYFSPRLGNERARIANLVKPDENVLIMFSGCGPYTIQIAKKVNKVTAIEVNPAAHKYALKNLILNKIKNATVLKGDVNKITPKLKEKFDRIVMPLPKTAKDFLKQAILVSKKGTIVHFYTFAKEDEFDEVKKGLINECKKLKKNIKILNIVKAGEYAPRVQRICVDFLIQ
ncbi:MAG: methyltransferase domain-containing protein, partial [Nanoarchaeota archaeon]